MTELKLVFDEPVQKKKPPKHLADFSPAERKAFAQELGFQPFRASQVATHYFSHLSNNPDEWTDIPAAERSAIAEALTPRLIELVTTRTTDGGMTRKDLWKLHDGVLVESVLMRYSDRTTVCISSQAGCGMNCPFCATGQGGLTRNLSAAEITDQIVAAARACALGELPGGPTRLSNIVFMGMGEPLANYNAVVRTLHNITDPNPDGLGISARSVVVSTDTLVPINNRFKVREVLAAADNYEKKTGRRYSIEYALIRDINDQSWRADLLGRLLKNRNSHVNLIPLNPTPGSKWTASRREDEAEFVRILESYGVPVTVRDTRGREIDGACGQLAASENAKN
jgi:23S rRNA (adenine2503-C2)-methyltransferase